MIYVRIGSTKSHSVSRYDNIYIRPLLVVVMHVIFVVNIKYKVIQNNDSLNLK